MQKTLLKKSMNLFLCGILSTAVLLGGCGIGNTANTQKEEQPAAAVQQEVKLSGARNTPVVVAAQKVGPAVVGITNKAYVRDFFNRVQLTERGTGSGVIYDKSGLIATNNHVVEGAQEIIVSLTDGRSVKGRVLGADAATDLAVVKIDVDEDLPVAKFGDSSTLQVGEPAIAIGNPLGLEFRGSVTVGVISALNRSIELGDRKFNLIQTDAAINPGNSGGALINDEGKVVGITVSSHSGGVPSYSVPIRYLNSLIGDGTAYSPGEYNRNHKPDASRCYSKHYPVPDFGTVTGVTLLGTIREGTTTTYYYDREEVEAGDKILLRYYAALGENTFYQFTGGSFTSSSTYPYSVKLYETSYDGIPAISVVVSSNSFASIGGLPQTVDFLLQEFVHYA